MTRQGQYRTLEEVRQTIFTKSIVTDAGCREYLGIRRRGYGIMWFRGKGGQLVHRIAWELANGPIPSGMRVLHHCDNPACFQMEPSYEWPDGHLFIGTQLDNIQDALAKERMGRPGERSYMWGRRQKVCRRGHPQIAPHVRFVQQDGHTVTRCGTCQYAHKVASRAAHRAARRTTT